MKTVSNLMRAQNLDEASARDLAEEMEYYLEMSSGYLTKLLKVEMIGSVHHWESNLAMTKESLTEMVTTKAN